MKKLSSKDRAMYCFKYERTLSIYTYLPNVNFAESNCSQKSNLCPQSTVFIKVLNIIANYIFRVVTVVEIQA